MPPKRALTGKDQGNKEMKTTKRYLLAAWITLTLMLAPAVPSYRQPKRRSTSSVPEIRWCGLLLRTRRNTGLESQSGCRCTIRRTNAPNTGSASIETGNSSRPMPADLHEPERRYLGINCRGSQNGCGHLGSRQQAGPNPSLGSGYRVMHTFLPLRFRHRRSNPDAYSYDYTSYRGCPDSQSVGYVGCRTRCRAVVYRRCGRLSQPDCRGASMYGSRTGLCKRNRQSQLGLSWHARLDTNPLR